MEENNYSVETEEEFLEDFGKNAFSDEELNQVLIKAHKNPDPELRIIVKELQYARFLLRHIVEFVEDPNESNDLLTIQKLVKNYVSANLRTNSKNL
jgi:hypothetical protein